MNPLLLLKFAPYLGILVALAFGGWEYATVKERDATIAGMTEQEAKNVAAAKQAVIDAAAADALRTSAIITQLQADNTSLQKEATNAQVTIATAPLVTATPNCPDVMQQPVVRAFTLSLPDK
jgi:hypothetical protein